MVLRCLLLDSPGLDRNDNDFVRHDKARDAHGHVECEHGVEVVKDHDVHDIGGLQTVSTYAIYIYIYIFLKE